MTGMADETFRCGFVAVVGRPNVGKSTFVNAVMGRKVSIVTSKPQTTRHRILAVQTGDNEQIVFVDTPGLHRNAGRAMNRLMNRAAISALADADLALFVVEAARWTEEDEDVLERIKSSQVPCIALLNKIDAVHPKQRLLAAIDAMSRRHDFIEIIPVSARKRDNLDVVTASIRGRLPESPPLFPADMQTDRSPEFHAAEVIRERLTVHLREELPYGLTVQVEQYSQDRDRLTIHAVIWVERDSQKGIVVGKGGQMLKKIGQEARLALVKQLHQPVHLELWVKVKDNWADSEQDLMNLGYESP
ncbi:MAG: GTPase Era [Gammaproteobacteria bacterium]|jgi:GTP-binding protein Era|nr:GTPase Era [Gammaproteobacteria bacterium]